MKAVGIKELKAHLSQFVRLVKGGETILVTDRNEVVAELRPPRPAALPVDELADVLDGLAHSGDLTRARRVKSGWRWRPRSLELPAGTTAGVLDSLRSERSLP